MHLSIITISLNNAAGLSRTIKSVTNQKDEDFEYIIVDGASSDNSVDIIREAETKRPISWVSEPDDGIYNAMNKGASMANGDYMLFLNSGDTLTSETVVADIKASKMSDDIVIGRINFIDVKGHEHKDYQRVYERHTLYGFRQSLIPHQATLIRRSTFLLYGPYDERYKIVADWQYCLKAIFVNGCTYSTIPVTIADFDNKGISSTNGNAMMEEIDKAFKDTILESIGRDYLWADGHKSDIERIKWLDSHIPAKKFINGLISLGQKCCK